MEKGGNMIELPRGIFVDFEGGDKSGKTTQVSCTEEYLKKKGISVFRTKEPGRGDPAIRERLLDPALHISVEEQLELFCKDRKLHVEKYIMPALEKHMVVLCDRFEPSTIAYQGGGGKLSVDRIRQESAKARGDVYPDSILLYDIDPEIAFMRSEAETSFEKQDMDYQRRVREIFLEQANESENIWSILDASQSIEHVWRQTQKCIDAFFRRELDIDLTEL